MILIVDDKQENLFSLKRTLEFNQFDVDTANSGENALKKILKNAYTLIILDVQMPGMDGFEVAEALSGYSKAKDIPIIFLSAVNTDKRFITKGYNAGAIDYITKPVDPDILLLKVRTFKKLYEQRIVLLAMQNALEEEVETRKKAQTNLQAKVAELQSTLQSIPQIAFTATRNGTIEFVNEHWFVYSNDKQQFPITQDGDIAEDWRAARTNGDIFIKELRIKNISNGAYRYFLLKITPIIDNKKIIKWVGTFTDIEEQKMANVVLEHRVALRTEQLSKTNIALEEKNHELEQFTSVASHDLKEPLRKIQVFGSVMKEKIKMGQTDDVNFYMDRIIKSSERMSSLINDLLAYTRLSAQNFFEQVPLKKTIKEIINDFEITIQEKQAMITFADLPTIEAVEGQMRQVFQNLISNSLKFSSREKTPIIEIASTLIEHLDFASNENPQGKYCKIVVRDNGIGFDDKYIDRIFTIFQRLNTREAYEGTGIGLAITKKIIEKHKGIITAQSKEGTGTSFIIVLPLIQSLPFHQPLNPKN